MGFHWVDGAVVVAYLIAITLFGARFGKSQHTIHDYFLGGRRLPWWAIAFSVVSAETSILTIISTPGIAFQTNLAFLQLVFGYLVARFVVAFVLIPRYFAGEIYTAYQLIEQRFGRKLRFVTASLFLVTRALAEGVRVFAISIVVEIVLDTGVFTSVVIITAMTLFYTLSRGLDGGYLDGCHTVRDLYRRDDSCCDSRARSSSRRVDGSLPPRGGFRRQTLGLQLRLGLGPPLPLLVGVDWRGVSLLRKPRD